MVMTTAESKTAQVGFGYDSVGRVASLSRVTNGDPSTTINTSFTLDLLDRVTDITHSKLGGAGAANHSAIGIIGVTELGQSDGLLAADLAVRGYVWTNTA